MGGKREGSNVESSHSKHKIKETQVSIIKKKTFITHLPPIRVAWKFFFYAPPTNQGWAEKEEGINDESSHSKHKIKETQVSVNKENSQGTLHPLIVFARKKKREVTMKAAIQNTKKESRKFQSSKKNIQCTHHPIISAGRRKNRGVLMKAAIQNTK